MKDFNITALKNTTAEEVAKILEPLHHVAHGSYNKWTVQRDKKTTYSYPEALEAIKKISSDK
jgi:hypothetical protein